MNQGNVMWVQISIYVLVLFFRFAAYGLYALISHTTISIDPDMVRAGVDFAFMGIGMFLGASTVTGFSKLNFKGKPFIVWLVVLSLLFILTYFVFIFFRESTIAEIKKDNVLMMLYIVSLMLGGTSLLLGGVLTGHVKSKVGDGK